LREPGDPLAAIPLTSAVAGTGEWSSSRSSGGVTGDYVDAAPELGRYDPGVLDFPSGLADLRERIVILRAKTHGQDEEALDSYFEYVDALVAVHVRAHSQT